MTNLIGKIKHLLSHRIPYCSPVIKTFQNLLPFSPAKVCLLLLVPQLANVFSLSPPPFLAQSCYHRLNKQMSGVFQVGITGLVLNFSVRKYTTKY